MYVAIALGFYNTVSLEEMALKLNKEIVDFLICRRILQFIHSGSILLKGFFFFLDQIGKQG